jgi:DNA polymerase III subunit epsilon
VTGVPQTLHYKTDLKKMGLVPTGEPVREVWTGYQWAKLYDLTETRPAKQVTSKQRKALEKARAAKTEKEAQRKREQDELTWAWEEEEAKDRDLEAQRWAKECATLRDEVISWARKLLAQPTSFCVLDTETTGLEYDDEACSIAVLQGDGTPLLDTLIRPSKPIPESVVAIHHITDERVKDAPRFDEVYPRLLEAVGDKQVLIYNESFDLRIMNSSLHRCGSSLQVEWLEWTKVENGLLGTTHLAFSGGVTCVMEQYARFYGEWSPYFGGFRYQPLVGGDHSSLGDCQAVLTLLHRLARTRGSRSRGPTQG